MFFFFFFFFCTLTLRIYDIAYKQLKNWKWQIVARLDIIHWELYCCIAVVCLFAYCPALVPVNPLYLYLYSALYNTNCLKAVKQL